MRSGTVVVELGLLSEEIARLYRCSEALIETGGRRQHLQDLYISYGMYTIEIPS